MENIVMTEETVFASIPQRPITAHKGQVGRVLLICGSMGFTGAATLCAMGALRSGAGLVYVGVPKSIYPIVAGKLNEAIVFPLPQYKGSLSVFAGKELKKRFDKIDCVVIGPGLGKSKGVLKAVKTVLKSYEGPVVLDADGINLLSGNMDIMRGRTGPLVLTPHEGEFSRICNATGSRTERAVALAKALSAVVILKGHNSVITDGSTTYINPTGNPGMAVGGSGDVLSGIVGTFLAQNIPPVQAAACAAWVHGKAGDICADEIGVRGMLPTDMVNVLPRLLK